MLWNMKWSQCSSSSSEWKKKNTLCHIQLVQLDVLSSHRQLEMQRARRSQAYYFFRYFTPFFSIRINIVCTTRCVLNCSIHAATCLIWSIWDVSLCSLNDLIYQFVPDSMCPFIDAARTIPQGKQQQITNRTLLFGDSARPLFIPSSSTSRRPNRCTCIIQYHNLPLRFISAFSANFSAQLFYRMSLCSASAELRVWL